MYNIPQKESTQMQPSTPTLSQGVSSKQPILLQNSIASFKKKKFKSFIFRNYKTSNQPGIVVFLLKQINQEILENLFFEIFRKHYKGVVLPNFLYFDSKKKVIKFKQIKPDSIVYFYITESDIDQNYTESIKYSEQQQPQFSTLEEQKFNLDLFILKESSYMDFLYDRYSLNNISNGYTELQFFLEQCYSEIWNYLEDFAQVSYERKVRLANVADKLENKREEIQEITKIMTKILGEFEEQEQQVKQLIQQMGFDKNFIDKSTIVQSRQNQMSQQQNSVQIQQSQHQQISQLQQYNPFTKSNSHSISKSQHKQLQQLQQNKILLQQHNQQYDLSQQFQGNQASTLNNSQSSSQNNQLYKSQEIIIKGWEQNSNEEIMLNQIADSPITNELKMDMFLPKCANDV